MTDDENLLDRLTGESTRRSVLKSGALATAGASLATGGVAAQEGDGAGDGAGDGVGDGQNWMKGILPAAQFRPSARFIITSPVIEWTPNIAEIQDNVWSEYNTRAIRYLNSNEQVLFWQAQDAQVPEFNQQAGYVVDSAGDVGPNNTPQPEIYRMNTEYAPFGTSGYVTVQFSPVREDEEDDWLDNDDWWYADDEEAAGLGDDVINGGNGNTTPIENGTNNSTSG